MKMGGGTTLSALSDPSLSTAATFNSIIRYLASHRPPMYVGENLAAVALSSDLMMHVETSFGAIGYMCRARVIGSHKFTSPQKRERTYIVALEIWNTGLDATRAARILDEIFDLLKEMEQPPKKVRDFLLKPDDPYLQAELESMLSRKSEDPTKAATWSKPYRDFLEAQGVTMSECCPPETQRASSWYPCLCEREKVWLRLVI